MLIEVEHLLYSHQVENELIGNSLEIATVHCICKQADTVHVNFF